MKTLKKPIHVQFVCHGNICRSPMAEFVFKDLVTKANLNEYFKIDSTATSREEIGNDTHHGTKSKLRALNIPFTPRAARQVTKADYNSADYLIIMDENNRRNLSRVIGPDADGKVKKMLSSSANYEMLKIHGTPATLTKPMMTSVKAARRCWRKLESSITFKTSSSKCLLR